MQLACPHFLPGVPEQLILERLNAAPGKEVASGKLSSLDSSAALAVNTLGWFSESPELFPLFPGTDEIDWPATSVQVEYSPRFPWSGGKHPWLDVAVETEKWLIGIESKRFEPFRDTKKVSLPETYDRKVWGDSMGPFEEMRDKLRDGGIKYKYLDAAQLVKHAFGLFTDAVKRKSKRSALVYLFAEPAQLKTKAISKDVFSLHREEIERFGSLVKGAEVKFFAGSYKEWLATWSDDRLLAHRDAVKQRFAP